VKAFDLFQGATFNLRAMCIWNIHDFLAYRLFATCVTKGLVGMLALWPSYKIMVFKEIEESHLLWESMVFAMDPSISVGSKCFQWGNGK
jgi:hypothetical protein